MKTVSTTHSAHPFIHRSDEKEEAGYRVLSRAERFDLICEYISPNRPVSVEQIIRNVLLHPTNARIEKSLYRLVKGDCYVLTRLGRIRAEWIRRSPSPFARAIEQRNHASKLRVAAIKRIVCDYGQIAMQDLYSALLAEKHFARRTTKNYECTKTVVRTLISKGVMSKDSVIGDRKLSNELALKRRAIVVDVA